MNMTEYEEIVNELLLRKQRAQNLMETWISLLDHSYSLLKSQSDKVRFERKIDPFFSYIHHTWKITSQNELWDMNHASIHFSDGRNCMRSQRNNAGSFFEERIASAREGRRLSCIYMIWQVNISSISSFPNNHQQQSRHSAWQPHHSITRTTRYRCSVLKTNCHLVNLSVFGIIWVSLILKPHRWFIGKLDQHY